MVFQFSLESVLKLRKNERDECRAQLAEAVQAEQQLLRQIDNLFVQLDNNTEGLRQKQTPGSVNVDQLQESRRYEMFLQSESRSLHAKLEQVRHEMERRRQVLVEADRELKSIDQLRDKQFEEYQQEQSARESRELDEIASIRFSRQKDES